MAGAPPLAGAISVDIHVLIAPPKSASKRDLEAMLWGDLQPTKRPDLDNVVKAVLDGMNGIVFADDAQVTWMCATKSYDEQAGVKVEISNEWVRP